MSDSHFTCESRSILTRTCRKPASPVAFALHLSIDGSATYSGIGETLCARRSGGSHEAPSHPTCHRRPARRHVHRLLMFRRPHPSITGAGSISASISATGSARAFGAIPSIPAAGRPAISTCGSRPTRLCLAPRRISTAPGSMVRSPAHFVVLGRNARPKTSGFRLCADGSAALLIGYCSMAPRAAHLAMLHWGKAAAFSISSKAAGQPVPAWKQPSPRT